MTAAPKSSPLLKSHCRGCVTSRTPLPLREADVFWEETGKCTGRSWRGRGPSTHARIVETTSGTTNFQQGLAATCKDLLYRGRTLSQQEDFGGAHEPVLSDEGRVTLAETAQDAVPKEVTPSTGKGALGKWRTCDRKHPLDSEPGIGVKLPACLAGGITRRSRGVCGRALKFRLEGGGFLGKCHCCQPDLGNPTVRDERGVYGNVGYGGNRNLPHKPKGCVLVTLLLMLRAPYFYPTLKGNVDAKEISRWDSFWGGIWNCIYYRRCHFFQFFLSTYN